MQASTLQCHGVSVELIDRGHGRPIVYLHSGDGLVGCDALFDALGTQGRLVAPSHPGFGHTDLPQAFRSVDDLAYFYLDLFQQLALDGAVLIGASFGGWIAAEIAIRSTARLSHLVLIDALGVRHATDETVVEIADIYTIHPQEHERRAYVEPARWRRDAKQMTDDELYVAARNRETLSLFGWMPYMHNPQLKRWLHRIDVPTLVLWGEQDGIVSIDYGRAYAAAIPGARFEVIGNAAHHAPIEQPERVAASILRFVEP